ncbi:MAG: DUF721 domain-containing protein [Desulfuromonadaceae bacterium]|nr:DUF721 domain-containing protein [Desulfuromonadaceae bacterium]
MSSGPQVKTPPQSARMLLTCLFGNLGISSRIEQHRVWFIWEKVVGPQIAAHARPARIRDNMLEIRVDHPVWMQQLQLLKPRILAKLNAELKGPPIDSLYLRRKPPQVFHIPRREPPPELPELNSLEKAHIEQMTRAIKDEGVRQAMQQLLTKQQRLDKRQRLSALQNTQTS